MHGVCGKLTATNLGRRTRCGNFTPRTSSFKPNNVGYEIFFHTDRKTYEALKAVNTKTTIILDKFSMKKMTIQQYSKVIRDTLAIQVSHHSVMVLFYFELVIRSQPR